MGKINAKSLEFLTDTQNESSNAEVDLKVMLPNRSIKTVQVERNGQVEQVLELLLQSLEVPSGSHENFALFETIDNNFERKLSPEECPFAIYVANFSTASATCLLLKPFVFTIQIIEDMISADLNLLDMIFHQVKNQKDFQNCLIFHFRPIFGFLWFFSGVQFFFIFTIFLGCARR